MYRNNLFQLIFENIYRYFLLLTIIQISYSKILFCSYQNDFLKFNNQIIRETVSSKNINSYYAVTLSNSDVYITTDKNTECSIINGFQTNNFNDHFTTTLIKNNTITLYDYNYTSYSNHIFNIVGLFKPSPLNKNQSPLFVHLYYDNDLIFSKEISVENYVLSFYEEILSTPGFHYFKIEVESRDIWCLCPNIGTGFENNKYIFAWTNTNTLFRENEYTYLVKTEDKKYSILV